ncbi:helix-turn-helix transcriptional regulator [Bacteroides sedimenti]
MNLAFNTACFQRMSLKKDEHAEIKTADNSAILFVLSGKVSLSCIDFKNKISEEMLFLAPGSKYELSTEEETELVKCEIVKNVLTKISQWLSPISENQVEEDEVYLTLPVKYNLKKFLEFFQQYYSSGLNTSEIVEWKQEGLFLLLKNSYSKRELTGFFKTILGENMDFKEFVYANYYSVKNLQEFADLAKCSLSVFCRDFKKNFGESAYQWMLKRKSQYVLRDILSTSIPFQELADKYQFSSQAHFTKFCKQRYNLTPRELRSSNENYRMNYQQLLN